MNISAAGELKGILEVMKSMKQVEELIAELYGSLSDRFEHSREFWLSLSNQEIQHGNNLRRMIEIVSKKPEVFQKGRPYNIFVVNTFIKGINGSMDKIRKAELTERSALFIARDLEQSLLEQRYGDIVKTDDLEYNTLLGEVVTETVTHKSLIDTAIRDLGGSRH